MLTPQQLELRRQFIGASDAAAVCGLDPYRNPKDVWLEKLGMLQELKPNDAMMRGSFLESGILDWAQSEIGKPLKRDVMHTDGPLCANLDAHGDDFIVEAKTARDADAWKEGVPDHYLIQVHHQFSLCPWAKHAFVAVLLGGLELRLLPVDRDDELAKAVAASGRQFWTRHVEAKQPPDDTPSIEVAKRIRRVPNKSIIVADEIADRWLVARAAVKQAKEDEEEAKAALLCAMADAEEATWSTGCVTYFQQTKKAYTVKESTSRVLRLKGQKN